MIQSIIKILSCSLLFCMLSYHTSFAIEVTVQNACDEVYGSIVTVEIDGGCPPYDVYVDGELEVEDFDMDDIGFPSLDLLDVPFGKNHIITVEDESGCTAENSFDLDMPLAWILTEFECFVSESTNQTVMDFEIMVIGGNPFENGYSITYPFGYETTTATFGSPDMTVPNSGAGILNFTITDALGCTVIASIDCNGVVNQCDFPVVADLLGETCMDELINCDDVSDEALTYQVEFTISEGIPPFTILDAYTGGILEEFADFGTYTFGGISNALPYNFIIVDSEGCQTSVSQEGLHCCLFTGEDTNWPPVLEVNDPTGNYTTDFNPCVGEEVCFSVQTYDFGDLEMVFEYDDMAMPNTNITINSGNDFGTFCWTPTEDEIGSHKIIARLYEHGEMVMDEMEAIPLVFHINVQCGGNCPACPTCINSYNMGINNAIADCNGNVLENGSIVVYPDPAATCPVVVRHPDGTGAYFSFRDLLPGDHSGLEVSLDGGYTYETLPTMTVGLDQMNGEEEVLLSYNASSSPHDECTGSAIVSVFEGEGNYEYSWSDCPNCDQADRTGLCAGTYTVMVTDIDTGCSNVIEIRIPLRVGHPYGGHGIIDFVLVPTVFSQSTDIIYQLGSSLNISLTIYTLQGQPIQTLINNEPKNAGQHVFPLDASVLANGTYLFSLETANEVRTRVGIKSN